MMHMKRWQVYCNELFVTGVTTHPNTPSGQILLTAWVTFQLFLAGYAIKRMTPAGSYDQLIFLFPIYLSNAFFFALIYALDDDMSLWSWTFWGVLIFQEIFIGLPKHFGLPEISVHLLRKHVLRDSSDTFPWTCARFVKEKIARSAWDNLSEM